MARLWAQVPAHVPPRARAGWEGAESIAAPWSSGGYGPLGCSRRASVRPKLRASGGGGGGAERPGTRKERRRPSEAGGRRAEQKGGPFGRTGSEGGAAGAARGTGRVRLEDRALDAGAG